MDLIKTVIIAVLVFGFLIFIHEFGHYIFARIFKVTITEFSLGMGPKLLWYDSKKTGIRYCISAIPFGGYVAMVGEDGESDDPNAFNKKPAWQRLIITVAGASVNIIAGVLAVVILASFTPIGSTIVAGFPETGLEISSEDSGLQKYDEIIKVNNNYVSSYDELSYEISRHGHKPVDLLVIRDGKEVPLSGVVFPVIEEQGQKLGAMDFQVCAMEKTPLNVLKYSVTKSVLIVRMCYESIIDLIVGRYSLAAVSGPVGISEVLGEAADVAIEHNTIAPLLNIVSLISINLGLMNLLPIPALDGGRTLLIVVEMIIKKKLPASVEAKINAISLAVLLGLSAIIMIKDVVVLFI